MKKLLLILILCITFQTLIEADEIEDFEIEGFSLGSSLLNYFSKEDIEKSIDHNSYAGTDKKFLQSNFYDLNIGDYDGIQFTFKKNDNDYIIHSISAGIFYSNMSDCLKKKKIISNQISKMFVVADVTLNEKGTMSVDKSGKSYTNGDFFLLKKGNVNILCYDWSDAMTEKFNWTDNLRIGIRTNEFEDWLFSYN